MEKSVPAEQDEYRTGVFYHGFLIFGTENNRDNLKNNINDQKVKTWC